MTSQSTRTRWSTIGWQLHQTDQFSSFEAARGGIWRAVGGNGGNRDSPPGVTELGNVVCLLFLFVFLKIVCRFQITDPLNNLAEVERGPLFSEGATWPPFCSSQGGQSPTAPPPAALRSALRPPAVCLPAGLPAWRRVKRLSWTWRMEPCTEWPVGYVERAWS